MIHHLAEPDRWAAARSIAADAAGTGDSQRAYEVESLGAEGFIHLSTAAQLPLTFARYYAGRTDLVLLDVDDNHPLVARHLRWEPAASGELFPHLHARLTPDAVVRARPHWHPTPVPVQTRLQLPPGYDDGSSAYDPDVFGWADVEAELVDAHNYWVTSVRHDGRPHAMPVWGIWLGDAFGFSSSPRSVKARNLAARPACVVHLESGDRTVILDGLAGPLTGDRLDAFVASYGPKYGDYLEVGNPDHGLYAFTPSVGRSWLEPSFVTSASHWRFDAPVR